MRPRLEPPIAPQDDVAAATVPDVRDVPAQGVAGRAARLLLLRAAGALGGPHAVFWLAL